MIQTNIKEKKTIKFIYEFGRFLFGLRTLWVVVPMIVLSMVISHQLYFSLCIGAVLSIFAVGFRWYGKVFGRAVMPGLFAGVAPLILPSLFHSSSHVCCINGICWSVCMVGCIGSGLFAGIVIGLLSLLEKNMHARWSFLLTSTWIAGLSGVLGCAMVGIAGIIGMAVSVFSTSFLFTAATNLRLHSR